MAKITINGRLLDVAAGRTILQAAESAGLAIPHFCAHPALAPEGTCRMCVVDIDGAAKLELSCSTIVRDGMTVTTDSPRVREARRNVLELLLADHPMDCPICDKAGECLLQDYYREYGLTESAFHERKIRREKLLPLGGKLILDRERCILCTRCVRFLREVTGTRELGVFERGGNTEIGVFEGRPVANAYSGNLVDLCPVGAITDSSFRFRARTWFLEAKPSVCPFCARGCRVIVDVHPGFARHPETSGIFRVRPRPDATPRGPWICDAGRYDWMEIESRRSRRLVWNKGGREAILSGDKAFGILAAKMAALAAAGRIGRLTIILHSGLTSEEWAAAAELLAEFPVRPNVLLADPSAGEDDGFLRTAERIPNRRGAAAAGLDVRPFEPADLPSPTEILIVFAGIRGNLEFLEKCLPAWENILTKVLVSPALTALDSRFDFLIPCAISFEKAGSFINVDGERRKFEAVRDAPDEAKPEGEILRALRNEFRRARGAS